MKRLLVLSAAFVLAIAAGTQLVHTAPGRSAPQTGLGHRPKNGLLIDHVRLFDSDKAEFLPSQSVLVVGDRIEAVGPDSTLRQPDGCEVIDGTGRTLLPGLFDMHAHLQASAGTPYLAGGVTTVRDLGNTLDRLVALKQSWDSGGEVGPRVLMAGPLNGSRGKGVLVTTPEEAAAAIERYKQAGYVQIKILGEVKPALVPFIVKTAHASGMRVSGHVPEGMKADEFVRAGADEIQHLDYVLKNLLPSGASRSDREPEEGARLDLDSAAVTEWINTLRKNGVVIDPTVNVFEDKYGKRGGTSRRYYLALQRLLKRLYDEGVHLVVGTDGPRSPGKSLHREMEIWTEAGIPASAVLQRATLGAARVMKVDASTGSVRAGKKADLVLVDGDPTRNMADIRKIKVVVKDGVVYKSEDLASK
jgi:imidazolonepropionase-like amidohydrolase